MSSPDKDFPVTSCRVCGCTEDEPCDGGCSWVLDPGQGDLCSACIERVYDSLGPYLLGRADPVDRAILARFAEVDLPDDELPPARLALARPLAEPCLALVPVSTVAA